MYRLLYVMVRTLSIFGFPTLRKIRRKIYSEYFKAQGISVSDRVYIVMPHNNTSSYIKIGNNVEFGKDTYVDYSGGLSIGNDVSISEGVKIYTHNHQTDGLCDWRYNPIVFSELQIEDNCWLGASSIILPSVKRIGRGAVVAAGAVVTKDVPELSIVAGNPAKVIRYRRID